MAKRRCIKRSFDIVACLCVSPVVVPAVLLTAMVIACTSGTNPFFIQKRKGRNNKEFLIYKIKTMADDQSNSLSDKERLLWFGYILRASRLDELPQIFNILKGDMSLVGPRPLSLGKRRLAFNKVRGAVQPGLTGPAQVNLTRGASDSEILEQDLAYIRFMTTGTAWEILLHDLTVLCQTPLAIYKQRHTSVVSDVKPGSRKI